MKQLFLLMLVVALMVTVAYSQSDNPFLHEYGTPFEVPPFDRIRLEHYMPALEDGMEQQEREIEEIAANPDEPTFANTVEALDYSGALLTRVSNVFFAMNSAMTSDEMQAVAKEMAPRLSAHQDNILLNDKLFRRIEAVYLQRDKLDLNEEQGMLLEQYYKDFVRGGAKLSKQDKKKLRAINEELSVLTLQFGENILKETNAFELLIENENDLAGLPEDIVASAAETAVENGHKGKWMFTLQKPSMIPVLQYSDRRELRERIFKAYIHLGDNDNEMDNKKIVARTASLRVDRSKLLGYKTYADYALEENMAKRPEEVYSLLMKLWKPALARAKAEAAELQKMIDDNGESFELEPWDWWYYAERLRKQKYDLDDEMLKPYFQLEKVRAGAFNVASRLYGITFEERTDIPKYHPDVRVFEVKEADGTHIGILYTDYFPRESKRGGAWMSSFRKQRKVGGRMVTPVIFNVGNFSKPSADKPSLLNFDEVLTMFHEFGHALHGLLSNCSYEKLSGTAVPRDFVELPSQTMENWALEPEVLKSYAKHYQTGETISDELIAKIRASMQFNQGFATTEYLAAAILDMDWHTLKDPAERDVRTFERRSMDRIGLIPQIVVRYRSPYFRHIFAGGYASGYYSYIWAEVLAADAFQAFKEASLFDRRTAKRFRENILAGGGSGDPMTLYKRFRGAEPGIEPLLKKRGLVE